jgi:CHAT domain-containing protein
MYRGPEALEELLKVVRSPRILHVITHGFFAEARSAETRRRPSGGAQGEFGAAQTLARLATAENPLCRSGFVLAGANAIGEPTTASETTDDGWVTAEEISQMDLHGTELVVLSACETGLGDVKNGEGVYGLRRVFLYAGAQSLVTSLFKVPDQATHLLMTNFYAGLKAGKGPSQALHDAKLAIIQARLDETGSANPFFWASFVLVGNPS